MPGHRWSADPWWIIPDWSADAWTYSAGGPSRPCQDPGHQDAGLRMIHASFNRIRFGLLPADIIGTQIYNPDTWFPDSGWSDFRQFYFGGWDQPGACKGAIPLCSKPCRKGKWPLAKRLYKLENHFSFWAAEPIEQEGTYRLPEAQVDRFYDEGDGCCHRWKKKETILRRNLDGSIAQEIAPIIEPGDILKAQGRRKKSTSTAELKNYILESGIRY